MYDVNKVMTSRASRRGVLKGGAALGIGTLGLGPLGSRLAAARLRISWKFSPGGPHLANRRRCRHFFDAFTAAYPGVEVVNSTVAGGGGVNAKACCRRASGWAASGLVADPRRPRIGRPLRRPRVAASRSRISTNPKAGPT